MMVTAATAHSLFMKHAFVGALTSMLLVACLGDVTDLGGPQRSGATLVDDGSSDGGSSADRDSSDPRPMTADASIPVAPPDLHNVSWYSWMPEATADTNQYLLPANAPTAPDEPGFIPANWDLDWARVEFTIDKSIGYYKRSAEYCFDDDGWFFTDGADGATATRYSLCPKSSAKVAIPDDFRLAARVFIE